MFRKPTSGPNQNVLQIWGNKESMNMNSMILTNIQASNYYKQKLSELKTYHEIIDEIYNRVNHLEPWEKGSRRTQGLTGMCGGVRGVGGGGIVSTCFCLLYKMYTLKLSKKQVLGLMNHGDSPYIRAIGFMYVRYTQDPKDLYSWFSEYLDDEEEIDVRAGGGTVMQIGHMLRQWLIRLEWYDTLFPRIPVPIQNEIMFELRNRYGDRDPVTAPIGGGGRDYERERPKSPTHRNRSRERTRSPYRNRSRERTRSPYKNRQQSRTRSRSPKREKERRSRSDSRSHHKTKRRHKSRSNSSDRNSKKSSSHKKGDRDRESSAERHRRRHHKKSSHREDSDREKHRKRRSSRSQSQGKSHEVEIKRDRNTSREAVERKKDASEVSHVTSKAEYLKKYRD